MHVVVAPATASVDARLTRGPQQDDIQHGGPRRTHAIGRHPCRRTRLPAAALLLAALVGGGACAGGADERPERAADRQQTRAAAAGAPAQEPAASPEAAVDALLTAEAASDHTASFRLLSDAARSTYKDVDDWARRRTELPPVTGFDVEDREGDKVVALVEHEPGLDPFVGLRAGRERQVWTAVQVRGGWLLEGEPEITPLFPDATEATGAAQRWIDAADRCDRAATSEAEAVEILYGDPSVADDLCRDDGPARAGAPAALVGGTAAQALVAQYGPETFDWARVVPVTGRSRPMTVVLAPIGDRWKVVAVERQ